MQRKIKQYQLSLSRDYIVFAGMVMAVVIALSLMLSAIIFYSYEDNNSRILSTETTRIASDIADYFDNTNRISIYMGKQVAEHGANDLQFIYELFRKTSGTQYKAQELFSWSLFDWVDARNLQLVNSKNGIAKNPPDMSNREYTWKSPRYPWTLQVSKPTIGNPSGKWVIPAGTGVTDRNGKYLGAIVIGFNIAGLTRRIENAVAGSKISFLILDDNLNIVMQSADNDIDPSSSYYADKLSLKHFYKEEGDISLEDKYSKIKYSHYKKMNDYPYIILAGFNKQLVSKEFKTILLPRIIEFIGIGLFFIALLYIFRRQIITPVTELSNAADRIARGEIIRKLPRSKSIETTSLAKQLVRVMRYMNREKRQKQEIESARQKQRELLKIIRDSDNEREMFLRELYHAMNTPLNVVIAGAELLKTKQFGNSLDSYNEYLEMIYNAGRQLESYATDIINPSKIDIKEIIERCVTLQKKKATEIRLGIKMDLPADIPSIMVDGLRMRQVIISILGHSLSCIQDFGTIKISAVVKKSKNNKPQKLIITIEDDGLGISENERVEQWERAFGNPAQIHTYSRNPDITRLSFPIIRHLIKLHHGTFELKTTPGVGSVFTITLPYLTKKELELAPRNINRVGNRNKNIPVKANVIKFPVG